MSNPRLVSQEIGRLIEEVDELIECSGEAEYRNLVMAQDCLADALHHMNKAEQSRRVEE